jgi:ATP-dependent DNA ligase
MLATKYQGPDKLPRNVAVQPKLDGVRCLTYLDDNCRIRLQSRSGKPLLMPAGLESQMSGMINALRGAGMDGELMLPKGYTFEQTVSAVRNGADRSLSELIDYHVYDVFEVSGETPGFSYRTCHLQESWARFEPNRIIPVETYWDREVLRDSVHKRFIAQGYEGTMYRDLDAPYIHGRTKALQKRKDFIDEEFVIIGHKLAVDQHEGCVVWEVQVGDRTCEVTPAWPLERRRAVATVAESYYGKKLTVRYQELTADGSLRFPVGIEVRDYE